MKSTFFTTLGLGNEAKVFLANLSTLVQSGVPLRTALRAGISEAKSRRMKKISVRIYEDVDAGVPLSRAIEGVSLWPEYVFFLLALGEQSGQLPQSLGVIAATEEKQQLFRSKIYSAMAYPLLVFSLTFFIGVSVAWFILPRLAEVFARLEVELPAITWFLIEMGTFLGTHGAVLVPLCIFLLLCLFYFLFIFHRTRRFGQAFLLWFAPSRKVLSETELARAGFILGTLLHSGIPIVLALDALARSTTLDAYQKLYRHLKESVDEGYSFEQSFEAYAPSRRLVSPTTILMIGAGEKSGKLPETFLHIGRLFEEEADLTAKNLTVLLEPILLVLVWLLVMGVAIAIILPLYSVLNGINK